jgi:chromosome segregation protein
VYLKALTLKGFKSFADPFTLLLEPGVTVVVGPNGSGKSNVVDAVAWVLGAQGPRTVRSSKMEDVIFAGSPDRPALGRAEVSLTIDNRTARLPGGLAEITITRTLFRSGESEYAINGQPCRLLDVQELLSDSGVGRQQHVIVSQGQLGAILDSRPEDRRAVIEEAAGVLKHRRRRERAERRLAATEENLDRLGDLVREVRRQIRPLERQAAATRSHASLAEELRALRLYLVGRELSFLQTRRDEATAQRDTLVGDEATLVASVAQLDSAADAAATELATQRDEHLVVALTRVQGLVERCRGLGGVITERKRSLVRALQASADTDVVSTLEADAARLSGELGTVATEEAALAPIADAVRHAEHALSVDLTDHEETFADMAGSRAAEQAYALARGQLDAVSDALEREQASLARIDERSAVVSERRGALEAEQADVARRLEVARGRLPNLVAEVTRTQATAAGADDAVQRAERDHRDAERRHHQLEARAEALARRLAEDDGVTGVGVGADLVGVIGMLRDVVDVDEGWESAFEAAVGAWLAAVVVDGADAARALIARLAERGGVGRVLAARPSPDGPGQGASTGRLSAVPLSAGIEILRDLVHPCSPEVTPVLDRLLAGVVAVRGGWRRALEVSLSHPDLVVVSEEGDRFSAVEWAMRGGAPQLATVVAEAVADAARAAAACEEMAAAAQDAGVHATSARAEAEGAARQADAAADEVRAVQATQERVKAELHLVEDEWADGTRHRTALTERIERDAEQRRSLHDRLPDLEAAAAGAAGRRAAADEARRGLENRRAEIALRRRDLEIKVASLAERRTVLGARLEETERRLADRVEARATAAERRRGLEAAARAADRLGTTVEVHRDRLDCILAALHDRRARQLEEVRAGGARLESLRRQRAEEDARLTETRRQMQQLELELAESGVRREASEGALRRELGCEPAEAMSAPCPSLPEGDDPARRAAVVEKELASLGPVNPLALEELSGLEERQAFLEEQVEDVRRARRDLQQVIRAVDDEIVRVFAEAFADVNEHFQTLVATLFPGGTGRLTLTDPLDLLDTGVEVEARPAGKNVRKLSLLSGGERSLVALAFLFAVFRSRPSPFYLLDEVEAALDDVNLHRFLDLLHEFRDEAQLVIVSHQKRTMEAADALYGVTMTTGGASKVVSQKVGRQPADEEPATAPV